MNRDEVIILNFVRKIKDKKQKKNMNKINQILLNLFMKNDSSKTDKLLYALRKWQLNHKDGVLQQIFGRCIIFIKHLKLSNF